jgi:hypothetical protein
MAYTINISEELLDFATAQAQADNVSLDLWCERKVNGVLKRLIKDGLIEKINGAKLDQITVFTTAVESAKSGIVAAEIENAAKIAVLEPVAETEATSTPK